MSQNVKASKVEGEKVFSFEKDSELKTSDLGAHSKGYAC